jgi:hypothetical protein
MSGRFSYPSLWLFTGRRRDKLCEVFFLFSRGHDLNQFCLGEVFVVTLYALNQFGGKESLLGKTIGTTSRRVPCLILALAIIIIIYGIHRALYQQMFSQHDARTHAHAHHTYTITLCKRKLQKEANSTIKRRRT